MSREHLQMGKAAIWRHGNDFDWCHLCGTRSDETADIWYPDNAEHDPPAVPGMVHRDRHYIRICAKCAKTIATVAAT